MRYPLLAACALAVAATFTTEAQTRGLGDDLINTYTEMIAANPRSADLYLSRAGEYQQRGRYGAALDDLDRALELAPSDEKGLRYAILCRRSAIRRLTRDNDGALADINAALSLYPEQQSSLATRAEMLTASGDFAGARADYQRMRRVNPRNVAAIFGLAQVEAKAGDSDKALAYADEAMKLAPRAGSSHSGKARVLETLGRPDDAIGEYIEAIFCGDEASGEAVQHLVDMSYKDYDSVIAGFDNAIADKPTAGILYYLRSTIAAAHNHHRAALADMERVDGTGPFAGGTLHTARAASLFALARYQDALDLLDAVDAPRRDLTYSLLRSRVELTMGHDDEALRWADEALRLEPNSAEAMAAKARVMMSRNDNTAAAALLAEAIMTDADNPVYYLIRATLPDGAHYYSLAADLPYELDETSSLHGFALLGEGKTEQADAWMSSVMALAPDADGSDSYVAACYYGSRGNLDKAFQYMERSLERGYANAFQWISDTTPPVNPSALRTDPRFGQLLERYTSLFR